MPSSNQRILITAPIGITVIAFMCLLAPRLDAADRLDLSVTPAVAMAPAQALIVVKVEPDPDNRRLTIVADSPAFFRSSQRELDGEDAARTHRLRLSNLPAGRYTIVATLGGPDGREQAVQQRTFVVKGFSVP